MNAEPPIGKRGHTQSTKIIYVSCSFCEGEDGMIGISNPFFSQEMNAHMNPIGARCAYQKLDSGIREFIFLEKSTAAVEEWLRHFDRIMLNDPPQQGVRELLLLDIRQHIPGAIYAARRLHAWRQDYDVDDANTRIAVLLDKQAQMVLSISGTVIQIAGLENIKLRFFNNDRQKAIDWLLSQR